MQSGFIGRSTTKETIKVGILHSLTGTMAISEKAVVDSTLLAIEELNKQGGVLGRRIEPLVADGQSDLKIFANEAERLIVAEKVSVVFGCWTSASRKAVKPIFEKHKHLLIYPVQYEGLEQSPNIMYMGATPNQQIIPAVEWCFNHRGKRFFLVGSDYIFPRVANRIINDQISSMEGYVVGEEYLLLGSKNVQGIIEKIIAARPDVILNTINGDSNIAFFKELRSAGITSDKIPTMSFSIGESELEAIGIENVAGDYASWNYFQSIRTDENKDFVANFKKRFGADRVVSDPMEAAYTGVKLWAQIVETAKSTNIQVMSKQINIQSVVTPQGMIHADFVTNHMLKFTRIGRIRDDGQFDIVWSSKKLKRPMPFPRYRPRDEWAQLLQDLYDGWGQEWAAR